MTRALARVAVGTVVAFALFDAPPIACAEVGVGVTSRSISVNEVLRPGDSCTLPKIGVANTGDEDTSYSVSFVPAPEQGHLDADPSWLRAKPAKVKPKPGRIEYVSVSLAVPVDAHPGKYIVLFKASPPKMMRDGNPLIVGAGTIIRFTVGGTPRPEEKDGGNPRTPAPGNPRRFLLVALAALAVLALLGLLGRNLRISVRWKSGRDE